MKYKVTVSTKNYQDYTVEADNRDEAINKVIRGEGIYGDVWTGEIPNIERVEVLE